MKKYVLITLVLTVLVGNAFAVLGDLYGSYPLPVPRPRGMAAANSVLFYVAYQSPNKIVRVGIWNGSFMGSWTCPQPSGNRGLAFTWGNSVWIGCVRNYRVYRCDAYNGSVMDVWSVDHPPYGLAANGTRDGGYNAVCILNYGRSPNKLYYHNKNNGSVLASYPITLADSSNYDIAYDWRNKLIWRYNQAGNTIDGTDHTTGSVVASFASPLPGTVSGLAYKLRFLFLAYPDCIARVHCPVLDDYGTSVAPASMGGIKAIFR